ncbi:MAG: M56 family metallopeptidase [Gemmatimonadota bacterium]|nr:M56 family metallopeptidase [Gemmatimonadota bacterium]
MIALWMVLCLGLTVVLGVASARIERVMLTWVLPTRWVWLAAIAGSCALSFASLQLARSPEASHRFLDSDCGSCAATRAISQRAREGRATSGDSAFLTGHRLGAAIRLRINAVREWSGDLVVGLAPYDRAMLITDFVGALVALSWLTGAWLSLRHRRETWSVGEVDGTSVRFAAAFGPAVIGVMRPEIVIPMWALELEQPERALLLTHEREHLRSHDARALALAVVLVALVPWNPALWWLFRRLRFAIEVDCDQRVLGQGAALPTYAQLLVRIGERLGKHSGGIGGASLASAAFLERGSEVRRRLEAITDPWRTRTVLRRGVHGLRLVASASVALITAAILAFAAPRLPAATTVAGPAWTSAVIDAMRDDGLARPEAIAVRSGNILHIQVRPADSLAGPVLAKAAWRGVPVGARVDSIEIAIRKTSESQLVGVYARGRNE